MRRTRPSETEQPKTSRPPPPPLLPPLLTLSSQHCFLSPATVYSWVYSAAHSFSTFPSISPRLSHFFSSYARHLPRFPPRGFSSFHEFFFFCQPESLYVSRPLTLFIFALLCCYHLLPSTLACICNTRARVYLKMIRCCFPVCVFMISILSVLRQLSH